MALAGVLAPRVKGFTKTAKAYETRDGHLVCRAPTAHILTDWLMGRKPDFRTSDEDIGAAAVIAEFHKASAGYEPSSVGKLRNRLNRWLPTVPNSGNWLSLGSVGT